MNRRVRFGLCTDQNLSWKETVERWQLFERLGIDSAWDCDHYLQPSRPDGPYLEAWTLLAALAAQTSRLRLGVIVTSNRLRSPALLAKMAATVDIVAGGRLDFGIGAGGSQVAGPNPAVREFEAYGVPLVSPGEAVRDLAESCAVIRQLWTRDEPFDFDGRSIRLKGAVCEPKPVQRPHPPVLIGGAGDRLLRVVAEHADIWNYPGPPSAEFQQKSKALDEHCAAVGRDPGEITRSMQTIVRCDDPQAPAATRALILEMIGAGVTHIVLAAVLGGRPVQWLADQIIEPVLAEVRHR